jgi:hypothetical protein
MKLLRVGAPGHEVPAVLTDDGRRVSAREVLASMGLHDYDEAFFGGDAIVRLGRWVREGADGAVLDDGARLGPPVHRPS